MTAATSPDAPLKRRLRDGLDRIGAALRADLWTVAETAGLNPTQAYVLTFIAGRDKKGVRVRAIAAHLGVSQPTATDSVAALIRKGLLKKSADNDDGRAVAIRITSAGRDIVRGIGIATTSTERALETLSTSEQTTLLQLVIKTIRALQIAGAISPQRMCVACRHFRPYAHDDARAPHHCAYVDAAFGAEALRLDCGEHEALTATDAELLWKEYAREDVLSGNQMRDATG
jgi:DNA-binding MarR family transcriptional regulator